MGECDFSEKANYLLRNMIFHFVSIICQVSYLLRKYDFSFEKYIISRNANYLPPKYSFWTGTQTTSYENRPLCQGSLEDPWAQYIDRRYILFYTQINICYMYIYTYMYNYLVIYYNKFIKDIGTRNETLCTSRPWGRNATHGRSGGVSSQARRCVASRAEVEAAIQVSESTAGTTRGMPETLQEGGRKGGYRNREK